MRRREFIVALGSGVLAWPLGPIGPEPPDTRAPVHGVYASIGASGLDGRPQPTNRLPLARRRRRPDAGVSERVTPPHRPADWDIGAAVTLRAQPGLAA